VNDNRVILIRLIVGLVFLSEGIQKYLFPELLGTGRFEKISFANPVFWAMAHEYRTDFAVTLLLLYLLIYGDGRWSLDSKINKNLKT
jgi:uncharacterized membrane protein YphA (DoxX/SURF4 family)